jgi:hypothetical protein
VPIAHAEMRGPVLLDGVAQIAGRSASKPLPQRDELPPGIDCQS